MADADSDVSNYSPSPSCSFSEVTYHFLTGSDHCIICKLRFCSQDRKVILTLKGCTGINKASSQRGDDIVASLGNFVHAKCRRDYINIKCITQYLRSKQDDHQSPQRSIKRRLRTLDSTYNPAVQCLFCLKGEKWSRRRKAYAGLTSVTTTQFQDSVAEICSSRGDGWSKKVKARLEFLQDCFARDVVYHGVCSTNFRTGKQTPRMFADNDNEPAKKKLKFGQGGRPKDETCHSAFQDIVSYLENNDTEQITVCDLVGRMEDILNALNQRSDSAGLTSSPYSVPYMKQMLREHFGDSITISESEGKSDVVTLKRTASNILRKFYEEKKRNESDCESIRLIRTAAALIRSEVMSVRSDKSMYPDSCQLSKDSQLNFLPLTLRTLLKEIIRGKNTDLKTASIGQCIMQATRPNTCIAPLQVHLAVQMHKTFASRFLVDTLYKLGFCSSYSEVQTFHLNAAVTQGLDLPEITEEKTLQFVADNADHNSATLDGRGTFHGMGAIAVVTPGTKKPLKIPRGKVNIEEVTELGNFNIHYYRSDQNGLASVSFKDISAIACVDNTASIDTLWKISWPLKSPRPVWHGLMQASHDGVHPGKSEVFFLPMIDLSPSDVTCIYSTLVFICSQARKYAVTPVVTFDQPLYMKAQAIVNSEGPDSAIKPIVLQLGNFHTQMSFLGTIGHVMNGSGLQEALEHVYAPNAIPYIMNGKSYSRAVRAHLLMDAALNAILAALAYDMPWLLVHHHSTSPDQSEPRDLTEDVSVTHVSNTEKYGEPQGLTEDDPSTQVPNSEEDSSALETRRGTGNEDLDTATALLENLLGGHTTAEEAANDPSPVLSKIAKKLDEYKASLSPNRTSALWLQYLEMIDILKMAIKAERTGNFNLHLQAIANMLPFFAATGHYHYTKSARLYLQQMTELRDSHPDVYNSFEAGHNVFRRSDRFWAGLSKDLVIEQVLMKALKTNGGLTRGTGLKERQRTVWLLSMPACAQVNADMQSLTGISFSTSNQHKESMTARQKRDHNDTKLLVSYLLDRNPFTIDTTLLNIANGRTAAPEVNADFAQKIGNKILDDMTGKTVLEVTIKKKNQVITLAAKSSVKVHEEPVNVDPLLLFQRLVTVAQNTPETLPSLFQYELSSLPTSLFDSSGLPLESRKSSLADYIWSLLTDEQQNMQFPREAGTFVIDGGSLLHRVPWQRGSTYDQLTQLYTEFVARKYRKAVIVFDGYDSDSTTKDAAHLRRNAGHAGAEVCFTGNMIFSDAKETFLSNVHNKKRFINLLSTALKKSGFDTIHARDDADCLIIKESLKAAKQETVVVVGEDTDLLVLLLYHMKNDHHDVYFCPGGKMAKVWKIKLVQQVLGTEVCNKILFSHAISGCDTTSRLFSIGKVLPFKRLKLELFRQQAEVFATEASHEEVAEAGHKAIVCLYGGKEDDTLDELRFIKYVQKVSTAAKPTQPNVLPPTASAAKYHSFRTYFQVQSWVHLEDTKDPKQWGWEKQQGLLLPIYTDRPVAPDELLKVVRCNCKSGCGTTMCTCRKHGLVCSTGCGECRGENCVNTITLTDIEDSESEEEK